MEIHQDSGPLGLPIIELKPSGEVWLVEAGELRPTHQFDLHTDFAVFCIEHRLSGTDFQNPDIVDDAWWTSVANRIQEQDNKRHGSVVEFKRPGVVTTDGPRYMLSVYNFELRVMERPGGRVVFNRVFNGALREPWRRFSQWCEAHELSKADFEGGDAAPPWVWDDVHPQREVVVVPAFMLMVKKDTVHVMATEPGSLMLSLRTFFDANDDKDAWQAFGEWVQRAGYCRKDFGNPEIAPEWVWDVDEAAVEQSTDDAETQGAGLYKAALVDALFPYIAVFTSRALFRSAGDALNAAKAVVGYLASFGAKASWEVGQDAWCKAIGGAFWHEEIGAIDANKVHADRVVPISIVYEGETVAQQQQQQQQQPASKEPKAYQAAEGNPSQNFAARTQYQAILLNGAGKLISEFASLMPSMQEAMDIAQKAAKDGDVPAIRVWCPEMGVLTTSAKLPPADGIYRDVKVQVYCSVWLTGTVTLKAANAKDFQKKLAELGVSALENVELRGQEDVSIEPDGDVNKVYLLETGRYDFNEDLNTEERPA